MDHKDPEWLVQQVGLTRYLRFVRLAKGDAALAVSIYRRDRRLRDALRPELEAVEIALRNRYHAIIQLFRPGRPLWLLDDELPVRQLYRGHGDKTYRQLSAGEITAGEAVEALSFGFWMQLTTAHHEHVFWTPYLRHGFPIRTQRKQVHSRVADIVRLRNRVQHNNTVVELSLRKPWGDMLWLLDRLNPDLAAERRRLSALPRLLD